MKHTWIIEVFGLICIMLHMLVRYHCFFLRGIDPVLYRGGEFFGVIIESSFLLPYAPSMTDVDIVCLFVICVIILSSSFSLYSE